MKAARIHQTGSPEVLELEEVDVPVPVDDRVLIRVGVAGVNFTDVMARQGVYISRDVAPALPAILGTEVAGVVTATGPGVTEDLAGKRVIAFVRGGYAEYAVASRQLVAELPPGIDLADATAFLVQGVTAWQLLRECGRIDRGETVLVHTAAGGVGTLAVQLAKALGASTVIATAGSADKRKLAAELGADVTVDYTVPDWADAVLASTGGQGVDIILDAVGGDVGEQSLACLAPFGRLVSYGVSSKLLAAFSGSQLMQKNQSVTGYWLTGRLARDSRPVMDAVASLLELAGQGRIHAVVRHAFPLEKVADAHRAISDRGTVGKVVLTV
ncbi:MAG TPA: NADPH:quinone oxidoreductase family protein [Micromonosporaceae bacterium]|nr:NADPH:quinone oxidoreductase family protein [Micromonosporaceae bacterium]